MLKIYFLFTFITLVLSTAGKKTISYAYTYFYLFYYSLLLLLLLLFCRR